MIKYEVNVYPNGTQSWYLNGNLHREDGPAIVWSNGDQEWWLNGNLHREDGPAIVWPDGTQSWYLNGKRHREDGLAVVRSNGDQEWWLNGEKVTQAEVEALNKPDCAGKTVTIDGIVYTLERKD